MTDTGQKPLSLQRLPLQLADGACTVLLDGLDAAPDRLVREQMSRLIDNVTTAYRDCRYVVTSRPVSCTGATVLAAFDEARIDPLSDAAVETFLATLCGAVYRGSDSSPPVAWVSDPSRVPSVASAHCDELLAAVRGRAQIRRMARNPVMLTALAVVHWNERRLPEQRAGRETADRTVVLLRSWPCRTIWKAARRRYPNAGRPKRSPPSWPARRSPRTLGSDGVLRLGGCPLGHGSRVGSGGAGDQGTKVSVGQRPHRRAAGKLR